MKRSIATVISVLLALCLSGPVNGAPDHRQASIPTDEFSVVERARFDEPIHLTESIDILHYWMPKPPWFDSTLWIFGEMQNTSAEAIDSPVLAFDLRDSSGAVIERIAATGMFHVIEPGQIMPFQGFSSRKNVQFDSIVDISVSRCPRPDGWESWVSQGYGLDNLEITEQTTVEITRTHVRLEGKVVNHGETTLNEVVVKTAFYDNHGQYVGNVLASIGRVLPDESIPFVVDTWAMFEQAPAGTVYDAPLNFLSAGGFTLELWAGTDNNQWDITC